MKTVISHMYNEEYLLPWWLEYHKKVFDHGIIIDYDSTDRSVEIVKSICPSWQVVKSVNRDFNATQCDIEIMDYERKIDGWRICLNITEFIMGNINQVIAKITEPTQLVIPCLSFWEWNPDGQLDRNKSLWEQKTQGVDYRHHFHVRKARSFHNMNNVQYSVGRHYDYYNNEELCLFHYAGCISSPEMLQRRLQIQYRIPQYDREHRLGFHHFYGENDIMTPESLKVLLNEQTDNYNIVTDCSELIKKYTES